jgi:hypothetical protein
MYPQIVAKTSGIRPKIVFKVTFFVADMVVNRGIKL